MEGDPEAVMDYYNALLADQQNQTVRQSESADGKIRMDSGTLEAEIVNVEILNAVGQPLEVVAVGENVRVKIDVKINNNIDGLVLGFGIKDRLGQMIFGTNTFHTKQKIDHANAGDLVQFNIYFAANLGVGSFSVHCSLVRNDNHVEKNYHWIDRAKVFEVINLDKPLFVGCAWNELIFDVKILSD